jgi:hypothetical protein
MLPGPNARGGEDEYEEDVEFEDDDEDEGSGDDADLPVFIADKGSSKRVVVVKKKPDEKPEPDTAEQQKSGPALKTPVKPVTPVPKMSPKTPEKKVVVVKKPPTTTVLQKYPEGKAGDEDKSVKDDSKTVSEVDWEDLFD